VALKVVPASKAVLDSPLGIPQGAGVRTLSRKSRLRDLAWGKSSLTWHSTLEITAATTRSQHKRLPDSGAIFEPGANVTILNIISQIIVD
jgi:hypothetical protein